MKLKILTTMEMKIITIYTVKKKRMRIISDIESESKTKGAENEENIVKAGFPRWLFHVFYNCF